MNNPPTKCCEKCKKQSWISNMSDAVLSPTEYRQKIWKAAGIIPTINCVDCPCHQVPIEDKCFKCRRGYPGNCTKCAPTQQMDWEQRFQQEVVEKLAINEYHVIKLFIKSLLTTTQKNEVVERIKSEVSTKMAKEMMKNGWTEQSADEATFAILAFLQSL